MSETLPFLAKNYNKKWSTKNILLNSSVRTMKYHNSFILSQIPNSVTKAAFFSIEEFQKYFL